MNPQNGCNTEGSANLFPHSIGDDHPRPAKGLGEWPRFERERKAKGGKKNGLGSLQPNKNKEETLPPIP